MPTQQEAEDAYAIANEIKQYVFAKLPEFDDE
jgi:hypothetical protein